VKPKIATSKGRISEMFQMSEKKEQALAILRRITGFQTAHQMAPQINVRVASARNILERLVDKGLVVRRGDLHTRGEYAARDSPPREKRHCGVAIVEISASSCGSPQCNAPAVLRISLH
jgi:DNA-binding Lrp family transcriptional regulator